MLIVFIRAVILYILIIAALRLMGKRQLGELQPAELVVTILVSNIATLPLEDVSIPMLMGIIPIFTLVSLDVLGSQLALRSKRIRKLISGEPKIIISNGEVDEKMLRSLRFTVDDLMESLRSCSVFDISEVQLAIVETTGKISVFQKQTAQPPTKEESGIKTACKDPPRLIISDGCISDEDLAAVGRDRKWIEKITRSAGTSPENVLILTADTDGIYTLIKKEGTR
ncbi:MAG: DUF421 domain-containing protein [Ruminococcus sp.]|nr:DUF421 domain-containing protein [Ruminococcus sp.]